MGLRPLGLCLTICIVSAVPEQKDFEQQAERCRQLLRGSVIDFYLPGCLDKQSGGYHEVLREGKFAGAGEKFLTLQARQIWLFSTLASAGYDREKSLAAASHGYD